MHPVCLWRENKSDSLDIVDRYGTVVGWGRTETRELSNELRQAELPVVDVFTCLESNPDVFGRFISRTNFCAGTRNGLYNYNKCVLHIHNSARLIFVGTTICEGDSGGSMTFNMDGKYYIRGIVSVGPGELDGQRQEVVCATKQYALFTDVAQYLPWIRSSVKIVDCEKRVQCELRCVNFSNVFVTELSDSTCGVG